MIEDAGQGRGRHYTLSAKLYQSSDNKSGYVRQKGIDKVRYPEMIIQYAKNNNGCITRRADDYFEDDIPQPSEKIWETFLCNGSTWEQFSEIQKGETFTVTCFR